MTEDRHFTGNRSTGITGGVPACPQLNFLIDFNIDLCRKMPMILSLQTKIELCDVRHEQTFRVGFANFVPLGVGLGRLIIRVLMAGPEVPMLIDRTSGPALWGSAL